MTAFLIFYIICGLVVSFSYDYKEGWRSRKILDEILFQITWPYQLFKICFL